jgi:PAS domain S-box-containing protein
MMAPGTARPAARRLLAAGMALTVVLGGLLTWWRVQEADRQLRENLLHQTTLISWALNASHVATLAGSESDLASPLYQRIKEQLVSSRQLYPMCRFLYIMRRTAEGQIIFLADSEAPDSENYSPPGQVYEEATEAFRQVFRTGQAGTEGPIRDRWGTWVSSSVPLFHPLSDRVVGVLGMDIDATRWRAEVSRSAVVPVIGTLALLALLVSAYRRELATRAHGAPPGGRLAIVLTLGAGLLVTALAGHFAHETDVASRRALFRRLATVQASQLQQFMFRIGDNYLEGVGRLFDASEFVDRRDFRTYVGYLLNRPYAQAWQWIPAVPGAGRDVFQRAVREWSSPHFSIWSWNEGGARVAAADRDVHYPVTYVEPQAGNEASLGFDVGSDSIRAAALESARATRLATATDPVNLIVRPGATNGSVVYRPVFMRDQPDHLVGFVAVALRMDVLLYRALSRESTRDEVSTLVDLYQLTPDGAPLYLASNEPGQAPLDPQDPVPFLDHRQPLSLVAPVFAFGKTYALAARPSAEFMARHALHGLRRTALMGLSVTLLVTLLVGVLARHRDALEQQVLARTAQLRESESSYHGLFNSIRQAIYILDPQGRFLDVNDGAVAMYGYAREEFTGQTPAFLSAPGRNDLEETARQLQRALAGEPQYFEFWGRRKNGEAFPKDVWICRGTYFGREVVIAVANDVSERKRAETEKDKLQAQLLQAQKMESVGRLAGGVAHDFNNMLQAILGNVALALEDAPAGNQREYLEEIQKSARRSADLTRQLLAFASRQTVSPRVIDLNDTISGMLKMLRRLIGEDIQLLWVPGADLWPVKMDPSQVDQILANLAVNARDAIGGVGRVTIETANQTCCDIPRQEFPDCGPGDYVTLSVHDTGRGMDDETRAHIFEPFYTTKGPGKGVGLGLATVFGIVKQNKGCIRVQSTPGQGTHFTISLPRTLLPAEPAETPAGAKPRLGGHETILLVEDEQSVLRFGEESLRRLGYQVLTAGTPGAALERARQHASPIHLLITDVVLPEMNGRELAQLLSSLYPDLRCLFMSGYTADVIAERGVLDERVQFIQKPFSAEALAARIREILEGSARA